MLHFSYILLSSFLCLQSISLEKLADNIRSVSVSTESDSEYISACEILSDKGFENGSDVRELFLKVPMTDYELDSLANAQNPDGSWGDIDYSDLNRGSWQPSLHAFRIQRLAIKYCQSGNDKALKCALAAMDFWFTEPVGYNGWWHTQVGIPRLLGPAFILLKDKMGQERISRAVKVMSAATLSMTGQNKIWLAGNVLMLAVLTNDSALALEARNEIISEIKIVEGEEGLQKDYSYHQHGPQLQFGNYGLSFAATLSWWVKVLEGTGLDFPEDKVDILKRYLSDALVPLVWKGYFDPNVCYRHVFPNAQSGKALCIRYAAINLGILLEGTADASYFPCSDFGIYRANNWFASIRMQSDRIIGFENTNNENMKAYFSSDGALMVRADGDEYDNIWPIWDWHHVPGVTAWNDGGSIWGNKNGSGAKVEWPYNRTDKVGGVAERGYMIAAMDYNRDSLTCRKSYFFFEDGVICLGAGITRYGDAEVTTTIEQNLLKGEVEKSISGVCHRGTSYVVMDSSKFEVTTGRQTGQWNWMSPSLSSEEIQGDIFKMYIDHGSNPVDASYSYGVFPKTTLSESDSILSRIQVISNTKYNQTILIDGVTLTVDWNEFDLSIR